MKKFWLIFLSLGLVITFCATAFAIDVKVGAEFYIAGMYLNKISLDDNYKVNEGTTSSPIYVFANPSTAFFYQKLRVEIDFIISPSLKLITRFDALERIWGGARSAPFVGGTDSNYNINDFLQSAGSRAENENIAFDYAYIDYQSPVGDFKAGYMEYGNTGTVFGNTTYPAGRLRFYSNLIGGAININREHPGVLVWLFYFNSI